MCGIIGIIGDEPVAGKLVDALKRLEYRGYDSAGIATLDQGRMTRRRAKGKLVNLEKRLSSDPIAGKLGIGHTRWATHGVPSENNAHPHFARGVGVVHNGIIENFASLRSELSEAGALFSTETDTEVVAHLIAGLLADGHDPKSAVQAALSRLVGAYALAIIFEDHDDLIIGARQGPPLAVGYGDNVMVLGSDAIALSPFTDTISYLEDGDFVVMTKAGAVFYDQTGQEVTRPVGQASTAGFTIDKGNHRHFMEKEIYEQPEVVAHTLSHYVDFASSTVKTAIPMPDFTRIDRLVIAACGTAYYAGLIGKYLFERYARMPVEIDIASEFRYRETPLAPQSLALFISQSGETADTLASLRYCREQGLPLGAIVNVQQSTIAREVDLLFPTLAGPEIGVASTKAFSCQLCVLASLAIIAGKARGVLDAEGEADLIAALAEVPRLQSQVLSSVQPAIETLSRELARYHHVLYLGRSTSFALAMEGALKLKEISYIHAEGYAAGELKHGPIALIDETMPVIVIAPHDHVFDKTMSNMQEVAARGGKIILITDETGAAAAQVATMRTIVMPPAHDFVTPLIYTLPIQLLAYYTAVVIGTDVDQPRNLAKSVTVE